MNPINRPITVGQIAEEYQAVDTGIVNTPFFRFWFAVSEVFLQDFVTN